MDNVVNRLAREIVDAIAASVADDQRVEACREKARAAGYEMRVTLEAVVGFANRSAATPSVAPSEAMVPVSKPSAAVKISANDRRFLRSLRIAVDDIDEKPEQPKQVE